MQPSELTFKVNWPRKFSAARTKREYVSKGPPRFYAGNHEVRKICRGLEGRPYQTKPQTLVLPSTEMDCW